MLKLLFLLAGIVATALNSAGSAVASTVVVAEFTLEAALPANFIGPPPQLVGFPFDPSRRDFEQPQLLPSFARHTELLPIGNYFLGVVDGGWNLRYTEFPAPNHTDGCTPIGCVSGWLNTFLAHDQRGSEYVFFNEPAFDGNPDARIYPTATAALAAAQFTFFDVKSINQPPSASGLYPVEFYIFDIDYQDNFGSLTLQIVAIPEPSVLLLFMLGLPAVAVSIRRHRRIVRGPASKA